MRRPILLLCAVVAAAAACAPRDERSGSASARDVDCRTEARREARRQMLADIQELERPTIGGPAVSGAMRDLMADNERRRQADIYRACITADAPQQTRP